jgi:hypothetical protein
MEAAAIAARIIRFYLTEHLSMHTISVHTREAAGVGAAAMLMIVTSRLYCYVACLNHGKKGSLCSFWLPNTCHNVGAPNIMAGYPQCQIVPSEVAFCCQNVDELDRHDATGWACLGAELNCHQHCRSLFSRTSALLLCPYTAATFLFSADEHIDFQKPSKHATETTVGCAYLGYMAFSCKRRKVTVTVWTRHTIILHRVLHQRQL